MTERLHTLVLGGARSGKSARALALMENMRRPAMIATAEPRDGEMAARIQRHRQERGAHWETVESPLGLAQAIGQLQDRSDGIAVDCLTLWLANLMEAVQPGVDEATDQLLAALRDSGVPVVLVSNEVGLGLVPETSLGRAFRDAQGRLNQRVAQTVATVEFIAAGIPLKLKG
ncbi:MAG: bifunctional adenosylcobinamide kinase/adenosylcobinamide-phosphate guanylyltransferase [Pseudomonadota bacterium]